MPGSATLARTTSTVAPQSLLLMNNEFITTHARHLADRLMRDTDGEMTSLTARLWRLTFAREATDRERSDAIAFVERQAEHFRANPPPEAVPAKNNAADSQQSSDPKRRAISVLCQALLSANEFLYVD